MQDTIQRKEPPKGLPFQEDRLEVCGSPGHIILVAGLVEISSKYFYKAIKLQFYPKLSLEEIKHFYLDEV